MRQYFQRKLGIYILTFFVAVTIDWMIPRFMPGDPVQTMLSRASLCSSRFHECPIGITFAVPDSIALSYWAMSITPVNYHILGLQGEQPTNM